MENIDEKNTGSRFIILPIIYSVLLGIFLLFKNNEAAYNYLYYLIPIMLINAILGTFFYNRNANMKLFMNFSLLMSTGCAFQNYVDVVYNPLTSYSLIKFILGLMVAIVFVIFFSWFIKVIYHPIIMYMMIILTISTYLILIKNGVDTNGFGTSAWITIGNLSIQLTDFIKLFAVIFYASLFNDKYHYKDSFVLFITNLYFIINLIGSILIYEMGSLIIIFFLHLSILFIFMPKGKSKRRYLIFIFLLSVLCVILVFVSHRILYPKYLAGTLNSLESTLWPIINKAYLRMSVTANIEQDPLGSGYQLLQGKKALWMAGLFGNSVNFNAIPVVESDMAFVGVVSSFGFIVGFMVVIAFTRIMLGGSELSYKYTNTNLSYAILVYGITVLLYMQAIIVILGSCNIIPLTGLPIPFISRGFTYQTFVFCFSGLLLNMSCESDGDEDEQ